VFLSGEGSEEAIEHMAGVSEATIEAHAAAAKISLIEILGLASLVAFAMEWMRRDLDRSCDGVAGRSRKP
jgi:hypothetical protein